MAAGVCHSDLHIIEGATPTRCRPCSATRAPASSNRWAPTCGTVKAGDHVITCLSAYCGHCEQCLTGHLSLCNGRETRRESGEAPRLASDGAPMNQFANLSSFAEQMLIHEHACVAVRRDIPFDRAALIGCGVMTGVGAAIPHLGRAARRERGGDRLRRRWPGGDQRGGDRRRRADHRHRHLGGQGQPRPRLRGDRLSSAPAKATR